MIHVACSADERFLPHCATMLQSLLVNNKDSLFRVHFLCRSLSDQGHDRLQALVASHGSQLQVHKIEADAVRDFPTEKFHASCWYRVLLPELLPDVARVLYIDADIVVLDDIKPLWTIDLEGSLFAAAVNPLYPFMPNRVASELGIDDPLEYLNSGVLLMDLEAMRLQCLPQKLRDYARLHPENQWPEQDALSVVCRGQWHRLAARWNTQSTVFQLADRDLPMAQEEVRVAREDPALVHFIGPHKPWHFLCRHPLRDQYHVYRRQTPWGESGLEGKSLVNWLVRPLPFRVQLRLMEWRQLLSSWRAQVMRIR